MLHVLGHVGECALAAWAGSGSRAFLKAFVYRLCFDCSFALFESFALRCRGFLDKTSRVLLQPIALTADYLVLGLILGPALLVSIRAITIASLLSISIYEHGRHRMKNSTRDALTHVEAASIVNKITHLSLCAFEPNPRWRDVAESSVAYGVTVHDPAPTQFRDCNTAVTKWT